MKIKNRILGFLWLASACHSPQESQLTVIGGSEVSDLEFTESFQSIGSLQYGVIHRCGATLIAPNLVVTAAHCLYDFSQDEARESLSLVFGVTNLQDHGALKAERIRIDSFRIHPEYNHETFENDIALMTLAAPSLRSPAVVDMDKDFLVPEAEVVVAGWGEINSMGTRPDELRSTALKVVDNESCSHKFGSGYAVFPENICAYEISADACHGDSGGPLYSFSQGESKLVGIVSWGLGCALTLPGVYTRVSSFDLANGALEWPLWKDFSARD